MLCASFIQSKKFIIFVFPKLESILKDELIQRLRRIDASIIRGCQQIFPNLPVFPSLQGLQLKSLQSNENLNVRESLEYKHLIRNG